MFGVCERPRRASPDSVQDRGNFVVSVVEDELRHSGSSSSRGEEWQSGCSVTADPVEERLVPSADDIRHTPSESVDVYGGCICIATHGKTEEVLVSPTGSPGRGVGRVGTELGKRVYIPEPAGTARGSYPGKIGTGGSKRSNNLPGLQCTLDTDSPEVSCGIRGSSDSDSELGVQSGSGLQSQPVWDESMGDSRMACLRKAPAFINLTPENWLLADVGNPIADMHWRTFVRWCRERNLNPLGGDRATPLNFLGDKVRELEAKGMQATSALPYKTTINNVWKVWQLPDLSAERVTTTLVRTIRARTPKDARYKRVFFAGDILDACFALGNIKEISFAEAHMKMAALLAICGACRKDDIAQVKVKDIVFAPSGNVFLPYEGKTKGSKGVTQIILPHVKKLKDESPATILKHFLQRPDWEAESERPGLILVQDTTSTRRAHKDTIGRYLRKVYERSEACSKAPDDFVFGPHAFKHSAVSSFKACGMSRDHMERYCRTSKATLDKWYDHSDRLFTVGRTSSYARMVLQRIVNIFTDLNPLRRTRKRTGQ